MLGGDPRTIIYEANARLDFARHYLPKFITLLVRDTDQDVESLRNETLPSEQSGGRVILILPEEEGKLSTPNRIVAAIDSINILYNTMADLMNSSKSDLVLASCDSGSDKIFDFTGLGEVISKLKEVLLSVWENAVYFRERKFAERVEIIAKTLPIIEHIGELEENGKIDREKAELMRRGIVNGVCKFVEAGSVIAEMGESTTFSPRDLLKAREALLLPAPDRFHSQQKSRDEERHSSEAPYEENAASMDQVTEEELREALNEVRRKKNRGSGRD